jgi:hypothetical protein
MCIDALTIGGLLLAVLSGGFLVGLVSHNDRSSARAEADSDGLSAPVNSQGSAGSAV